MIRCLRWITDHPVAVLLGIAALCAAALAALFDPEAGRLRLDVDPSIDRLLPKDDEDRRFYESTRRVFGSDEPVFVALATQDAFAPESLRRLERLTRRLEELPGVQRVLSLATAPNLRADDEGIVVDRFVSGLEDPAALRRLREDVRANPLYRGILASDDDRAAALLVYFEGLSDRAFLDRGYAARIRAIAREEAGDAEVWITGAPIVKAATTGALLREIAFVVPATLVVGAAVLLLAFGTLRGVLLPVATIGVSLLWTLGTLAWIGIPLNLVTAIVPPLVITLGLAYAMHVLAEYDHTLEEEASAFAHAGERVCAGMQRVALPLAIAALTTIAGLLALALSPLAAVREFGLVSALGVGYTTLLCFTLVPACLRIAGRPRASRTPPAAAFLARASEAIGAFDIRQRRAILWSSAVLLLLGAWGATRIQVGASYIRDFPADSVVRSDYEAIERVFRGANVFHIVLETNLRDALTHPDLLADVEALQQWLEEQPEIEGTTSLVDHLKLINRSVHGDPEHFAIPDSQRMAKQLLVFGGGEQIEGAVDLLFHSTRIAVRANVESSAAVASLLERIEAHLETLPGPFQARATGGSILLARTVDRIARGQLASVATALVVIYAILAALFTSFRVGLLALLPNAVPVAVYFGALGWAGIALNPSTSLIACIALGIAVDDTVHYLVRFQNEARRRASEREATLCALRGVIRPISFTTLALCLGFLLLATSELRNQVQFGALAAFTLAVAWAVDLSVTPALCSGVRIVTFWDVLRIDLGQEPQRSIPLLHGLSTREARTVALILDIRHLAAGEPLVREGEPLSDVFVVIEGELEVWTERDGARVHLHGAGRGDVVGEVGFFAPHSPATVEAVTDARLLRFEDSDLEYLVRRHPRIAAHIYRNLSHVQAHLLVQATRRIR